MTLASACLRGTLALLGLAALTPSARALPAFARRYNVSCSTCHTTAPRLNRFGYAFQANFFNWPKGAAPAPAKGVAGLPVSAIVTPSHEAAQGEGASTAYRALELYPSDGFALSGGRRGGYFADLIVHDASGETLSGTLEEAYVGLPITRTLGVIAGQATGLLLQWDPINSLTDTKPGALDSGAGGFGFAEARPTVRLDWFSGRGTGTADGTYVAVGAPFDGGLALNRKARIGGQQGLYGQAFQRRGPGSVGVFGYQHGSDSRWGLLATRTVGEKLHLMAAQSQGRDSGTWETKTSVEAEVDAAAGLALTGRWEWSALGAYPVAALTYAPQRTGVLRFTVETAQPRGARTTAVFARVQL